MPKPVVALVGAYERDNFGDLLFGHVTRSYLSDYETLLTAPLSGSVDELMGASVLDYRDAFTGAEQVDAVWTVGGQVGGARPHSPAYNYPGTAPRGPAGLESPYVPRMTAYPSTRQVPFIVNSVGVGGVLRADDVLKNRLRAALAEADAVSVRDRASAETLEYFGVPFLTSPDVVHTIKSIVPQQQKTDEVLIQFASKHFSEAELQEFVEWVKSSTLLKDFEVVLFAAGVAPHHDSVATYEQIAQQVREANVGQRIRVEEKRDPLFLASLISRSRLWLGSSLHGRVIASAYDVPRLAWNRHKLISYCQDWDPEMPYDVTPRNAEERVKLALSMTGSKRGDRLALLADRNMKHMMDKLGEALSGPGGTRVNRRVNSLAQFVATFQ